MIDDNAVEKIERYLQDMVQAHQAFTSWGSRVYEAELDIVREAARDGALEKKHKECVAIGISMVINCEPCQVYHINEALKSGATADQIMEVMQTAMEIGGGPVVARSNFALQVLEYFQAKT